jgi:hypothetical protein
MSLKFARSILRWLQFLGLPQSDEAATELAQAFNWAAMILLFGPFCFDLFTFALGLPLELAPSELGGSISIGFWVISFILPSFLALAAFTIAAFSFVRSSLMLRLLLVMFGAWIWVSFNVGMADMIIAVEEVDSYSGEDSASIPFVLPISQICGTFFWTAFCFGPGLVFASILQGNRKPKASAPAALSLDEQLAGLETLSLNEDKALAETPPSAPPSLPNPDEILAQAKQHILAKEYRQARQLLAQIPGNAAAQKWLKEMDARGM